jgi:hypothetical protein
MFKKEMKSLIVFAVSKDISGIETKVGYNGAPILKICSNSLEELTEIKQWCDNLGYSNKILSNEQKNVPDAFKEDLEYCLFCVFGEDTEKDDYYKLL